MPAADNRPPRKESHREALLVFPIDIRPDKLSEEMLDYSRKLGQGMENLLSADAIDTGVSPKDAVYSEDKLVMYRYQRPSDVAQQPVPLLIVYALVNRPYMTDIQENRSTIKGLLATGQDVYLIDWGYPDQADRSLTLDEYINGYLVRCVDHIRETHGLDKINILGICQGGSFSLMYTALHPDKVQNLVTMVTPVDFKTPDNLLSAWVQNIDIDLAVDTMGNVPGELLNWTFLSLKPFSLTGQKYVNMVDLLDDIGRATVAVEGQLVVGVDGVLGRHAGVDVAGVDEVLHALTQLAAVVEHLFTELVWADFEREHERLILGVAFFLAMIFAALFGWSGRCSRRCGRGRWPKHPVAGPGLSPRHLAPGGPRSSCVPRPSSSALWARLPRSRPALRRGGA